MNYDGYLSHKELEKIFKVNRFTLFNWRKKGLIDFIKINSKTILYKKESVQKLLQSNQDKKRKNVIYCRVSNTKQKDDLQKQKQILQDYTNSLGIIVDTILSEIASGMNEERKEFNKLINMVVNEEVDAVYISYKDRLTRFGFKYFENLFSIFGTKIIVINNEINQESFEQEMIDDLTSIIHHFSMKMYSNRRKTLKEMQSKLK